MRRAPNDSQVEFASQPERRYSYYGGAVDDDAPLELAWVLTVHKSQGSEFETILMLPAGVRNLSRELLYTALTRQTERVIICHERPLDDLLQLTRATGSDTARRLTDLLAGPAPAPVIAAAGTRVGILDAGLVHITGGNVLVRSKNEVIVAGILDEVAPGSWAYWEHLGMLEDPIYEAGWQRKKQWYASQGRCRRATAAAGPMGR